MYIKIFRSDEHPVVLERCVNNFIADKDVKNIAYAIDKVDDYVYREVIVLYD